MPTLRYWDASQNQYIALPAISSSAPSNMVSTILTTPTVAASPYTITHNFGTTNVMVQAWDTVTNDLIVVRMHVADANHVQVYFEQNCPNNVNVLCVGGAGSLAPAPVVAARMYNVAAGQSLTATTYTTLIYDTVEYDTHGGCTTGTGTYTVPVGQPGDYLVTAEWASTTLAGNNYAGIAIFKNGTQWANGAQFMDVAGSVASHVSSVVRCNAGDTLVVRALPQAACTTFSNGGPYCYMTVHRIFPGLQAAGAFLPPQVPPPTGFNSYTDPSGEVWASLNGAAWKRARDVCRARVWRSAAFNLVTGWNIIPFDVTDEDPAGAVVLGSNAGYVVRVAGHYQVSGCSSITAAANSRFLTSIWKNGGEYCRGMDMITSPTASVVDAVVSSNVTLAVGDNLQLASYATANPLQPGYGVVWMTVQLVSV